MENKIIEATQNLLEKIHRQVELIPERDIELTPLLELSGDEILNKVIKEFNKFKDNPPHKDMEAAKLVTLSKELMSANVESIEVTHRFEPTFFGDVEEIFKWSFHIEFTGPQATMEDDILKTVARIEKNNQSYNEKAGRLRYTKIVKQSKRIHQMILNLKQQLPILSDEKICLITSLMLYDFERMSAARQYDFLSYKTMHSQNNPLDEWVSCLNIQANYKKPHIELI